MYYIIKTTHNRWIWRRLLKCWYCTFTTRHHSTAQHGMLMWRQTDGLLQGWFFFYAFAIFYHSLFQKWPVDIFILTAFPLGCVKLNWSGPGWLSRYRNSLRTEVSGIESRWGVEIFCTRPYRPWDPLILLYNGYRVILGGKAAGAWRWPPITSSAEVKGRKGLYLCCPFGPSWPVIGWT